MINYLCFVPVCHSLGQIASGQGRTEKQIDSLAQRDLEVFQEPDANIETRITGSAIRCARGDAFAVTFSNVYILLSNGTEPGPINHRSWYDMAARWGIDIIFVLLL